MGNGFSQNDPPPGLIDLTVRMLDEGLDLDFGRQQIDAAHCAPGQRLAGLVQIVLGDLQVGLVRLNNAFDILLLLRVIAGLAALGVLRGTQVPLQVPDVVGVLPPVAQALLGAQACRQFDHLARGVKKQADIRRVMHIRLNHEGVATPTQDFAGLFFTRS